MWSLRSENERLTLSMLDVFSSVERPDCTGGLDDRGR
jgi:hypothetical protein